MQVWRIGYCKPPTPGPSAILQSLGFGSTLANGRWHLRGPQQIVYAASSRALCQLEKRVHSNGANLKSQILVRLDIPEDVALADVVDLPTDWRSDETATQQIGMQWIAGMSSLGLWVPSFIEPLDRNLLLNPAHPDYLKVVLTVERDPFAFDPRLFP